MDVPLLIKQRLRALALEQRDLAVARASLNGGAIIDHEAPRERRFVAVKK